MIQMIHLKSRIRFTVFLIGLISLADNLKSQPLNNYCYPDFIQLDTNVYKKYPFINLEKNNFQFFSTKSENWETFYKRLNEMIELKRGKLRFYHIGGSHIQADIYSHDFRTFLQSNWTNLPGERGMVFPFDLSKTNNPSNYDFSSPNEWSGYRSVTSSVSGIAFGLTGAAMSCSDSLIGISFRHNRTTVKPPYSKLRIYHNKGEIPFDLHFGDAELLVESILYDTLLGYTEIHFTDLIENLDLQLSRRQTNPYKLIIYGFQFMNNLPGISYSSIGINGAGLYTYLANPHFEEQLKAYPPDFFAFSVGINDGNVPYESFDPNVYKSNLEKMMNIVLRCNPQCAILLTVPNDAHYKKRHLNKNIAREREVIIALAEKYRVPVWDFYGIMGELGSSKTWLSNGLMQGDMVHFTSEGYHIKGALLIDAFMKYLEQMTFNTHE